MNATTHGLSVKSLRLFRGDTRELQAKLDAWMAFYEPTGPGERALIERAVVALIQKRRCIAAACRHVREAADPADRDTAIPWCATPVPAGVDLPEGAPGVHVLALYRRYEQMHRHEFHRAFRSLLNCRAEAARAMPGPGCPRLEDRSDDALRGLSQVGYY